MLSPAQLEADSIKYIAWPLMIVPLSDGTLNLYTATTAGPREFVRNADTFDELFDDYLEEFFRRLKRARDREQSQVLLIRKPVESFDLDLDLKL